MSKSVALLLVLVLAASGTITLLSVNAASRTIVVPDDYPTIAAAVGNATQGDTVYVKKGTYKEHSLVINKTITLIGEDKNTTIIENIDTYDESSLLPSIFLNPLIAVEIRANNVKLWNFKVTSANRFLPVNTSADGVQLVNNIFEPASEGMIINGDGCIIVRNILEGMVKGVIRCTGTNNTIAENKLTGSVNSNFGAIYVDGLNNLVYGNTITDVGSGFGRLRIYGDVNTVAKNNLTSSAGIEILRGSDNIICGNRILFGGGLSVAYGNNNIFYANHIENGGVGAIIGAAQSEADYEHSGPAASNNTLYNNNFINNTEQVLTDWVGYGVNYFDNGNEGNFWSDYTGEDVDGDGVGDAPYIIDYKREDRYPLMASFDIDSVTVELPEWETPSFVLPQSEPFPVVPVVAASAASIVVVVVGLLFYFRKRSHQSEARLVKKS